MSELKPCPHCGGTDLQIVETDMTCCIRCCTKGCWLERHTKEWKPSAIKAWNTIPRHLRWTKEPPTEPGFYWFRNEEVEGIIQICNSVKGLYVMYHGNDEEWDLPEGEWSGPIQEPVK